VPLDRVSVATDKYFELTLFTFPRKSRGRKRKGKDEES